MLGLGRSSDVLPIKSERIQRHRPTCWSKFATKHWHYSAQLSALAEISFVPTNYLYGNQSMNRSALPCVIAGVFCCCATTLAFAQPPVQIMPKDYDESFPNTQSDVKAGSKELSKAECDAKPNTVWVSASWEEKGVFTDSKKSAEGCIRYFPSDDVGINPRLMVYLEGDMTEREGYKSATYKQQVAQANSIAKGNGFAVAVIGRPGVMGSTGANHWSDRRTPIEAHLVNAAVTAIKEKHGYSRIDVAGQSGGGGLIGAMLSLGRNDLNCVAISSGGTAVRMRSVDFLGAQATRDTTGRLLSEAYDPYDHVDKVVQDQKRHIYIIADRQDKRVSFRSQEAFKDKLAQAGHHVYLVETVSPDTVNHHGLGVQARRVAGWCAAGFSDEIIAGKVRNNEPSHLVFVKQQETLAAKQSQQEQQAK